MKIIVDTNIAFSAILNSESTIGDLIFNSHQIFQFWSCHYLIKEIDKHWNKLKRISKLNEEALLESQRLVYRRIKFIDEGQIPKIFRLKAFDIVKQIDLNDIVFVALNEYQESLLWTGDKKLLTGLKQKGYISIISTSEMILLRNRLRKNS